MERWEFCVNFEKYRIFQVDDSKVELQKLKAEQEDLFVLLADQVGNISNLIGDI